jgi:hypothetical protein
METVNKIIYKSMDQFNMVTETKNELNKCYSFQNIAFCRRVPVKKLKSLVACNLLQFSIRKVRSQAGGRLRRTVI